MASSRSGTLDTGSRSDLMNRVWKHKNNRVPGFTARYNVHILVYYKAHEAYVAIARREYVAKIGADNRS